ncbi:MAG: glycosyltransferase, partial [Chloroflexi bacterium]|nr:glycosyltransferase [Chloroflexota bacterium]
MRVLHVSHQYPPAIGGSERYIADLSEELVARGHQVDVFTSRAVDFHTWQNKLPKFEQRQGVNVYR